LEGGRGIFLIAALADEVTMKPAPGYGTQLRIVLPIKRRSRARLRGLPTRQAL
jgi:anti-sigma regulatory factor (Ser/Thr protein kinase)